MNVKCFILFLYFLPIFTWTLLKETSLVFSDKPEMLNSYPNMKIKKMPEVTDHVWFLPPWVSDNGNSPIPYYSSNICENYVNLYHFSNNMVKWTITSKTQWPKAVRANITRWKPGTVRRAPHKGFASAISQAQLPPCLWPFFTPTKSHFTPWAPSQSTE